MAHNQVPDAQNNAQIREHADLYDAAVKLATSEVGMLRQCELTTDDGCERCKGEPVAARYEHGFIDIVCDKHAAMAEARGVLVLRATS